jgi:ABC-type dipeptide/oligopeptide/nickel transport system ATPase subunit
MKTGLVINLFGGPGSGKTTTAAELFALLKKRHYDVELVTEFAKDLIMQNNPDALAHQFYVSGVQAHRILSAAQKMQVVIVDSPILLGPIYDSRNSLALLGLCLEYHRELDNLNIILGRKGVQHSMVGRVHSLTESVGIDNRIHRLLDEHRINYISLDEIGMDGLLGLIGKLTSPTGKWNI